MRSNVDEDSQDKAKLTEGLPKEFHEFIFGEPVNTVGTTFCTWNVGDLWISNCEPAEESLSLMKIFDGKPKTYVDFANDYYEPDEEISVKPVKQLYEGIILSKKIADAINADCDYEQESDLEEIDYPYEF